MNDFKLCPADVLVNINDRHDLISMITRWALGSPYFHNFLYMGNFGLERIPMLFESNGRGVVLQSLSNRYGQKVVVMRLKSEHDRKRIPQVLEEAVKLASNPQSYYDYLCIFRSVLPRLIREKLHLPIPLMWQRDSWQICSEAIFEVFYRAALNEILLPYAVPPLPGDFVTETLLLDQVWTGSLSEEVV